MWRAIIGLVVLAGCCGHGPLNVRHQYLDSRYLASSHVGTPDPNASRFYGQQLIIQWAVPKEERKLPNKNLLLTVRFGNAQVKEVVFPIQGRGGTCRYRLLGRNFCDKRGVITYKIEMRSGDCVLREWTHQVWAELVEIEDDPDGPLSD